LTLARPPLLQRAIAKTAPAPSGSMLALSKSDV
jgi:hypothetical protein